MEDADVVHIHEPFVPMVSLGALIASTPPKVGTFHADPSRAVRMAYRAGGPVLGIAARRLSVVTAVSAVAASAVDRVPGVRIIPNGIDVDQYRPSSAPEPFRVMFLGRDDPRKGLDVLLQAWPLVRRVAPEAVLGVVGTMRARGPEGVEFLGRLSGDQKIAELRRASVLVAPNLGGESFGLVVLEGLAAGCAVVASDLPAFRAVAGDSAEYVPVGDPPGIAAAVGHLLSHDSARADLSERAVARARLFGRDVVLGAYLAAYREAIEQAVPD